MSARNENGSHYGAASEAERAVPRWIRSCPTAKYFSPDAKYTQAGFPVNGRGSQNG